VRRLLSAAAEERYAALYVLAVTAGLRRGELLGLAWEDIDLERGVLQVRRTLQKGEMLPPKTPKSRRQIRLTRRAVNALCRHWRAQETERLMANGSWMEQGLVFPNKTGNPTDGDNLYSRHFRALLKRAGLLAIRFHDLRHTCATLLLTKGVHPKVVSEMLGHATVSITLDTYSHVIPGLGDAAASAMDDALEEGGEEQPHRRASLIRHG
jgi:integrase